MTLYKGDMSSALLERGFQTIQTLNAELQKIQKVIYDFIESSLHGSIIQSKMHDDFDLLHNNVL